MSCRPRTVIPLILGLLSALPLPAQSTFGSIVGTVQDASGSIVPGAAVRITNLDSNVSRESTSNAQGLYQFVNINSGRYSLLAEKSGFASVSIPELRLDARQERRADLTMNVAVVAQTVEVSAQTATINTENATISDTKDFRTVTELPVNYRGGSTSPLGAIVALSGVQQDPSGNISVGGAQSAQMTEYSIDGVNSNAIRSNGGLQNVYPSSELLDEFKVSGVNNNAELGSVGDVTITTKSGSNLFHGSAFEYLQNKALDARTYGTPVKQSKVWNTFGGSFSGPVIIPGLYNGRNKTFFFVDYEANRRPGSVLQQLTVPTAAMRTGNLTGVPGGAAVDPTTGAAFPNNTIPTNQLNPVAIKFLSTYYPLPITSNGVLLNNYPIQIPLTNKTDGFDFRIDQYLSSKHQIYGRYSQKAIPFLTANTFLAPTRIDESDKSMIISDNYSLTASLINEARFGFSLFHSDQVFPVIGADVVSALGLTGLDVTLHPGARAFPCFNFSDGTGFSSVGGGNACGSSKVEPLTSGSYSFNDNVSWIKGRHSMKFGFDVRRAHYEEVDQYGGGDEFGSFAFLRNTYTGNAFADFLLGLPYTDQVSNTGPRLNQSAYHWSIFGQDEFRVAKSLTINFGLRWELFPPFSEATGNISQYIPETNTLVNPDKAPPVAPGFVYGANICTGNTKVGPNPSLPCTPLITASEAGLPQGLRYTYKKNFDPRFSIAWRPFGDNRTVFRAGFGIFTMAQMGTLAWYSTAIATTDSRVYTNTNPASFVLPQAYAGTGLSPSQAGTAILQFGTDLHLRDPQSAQWNVSIERELSKGFTARVSYIGMNTYRLATIVNLNQVAPSTIPYTNARKPVQNWGARLNSVYNQGFANYQALETQISHRFAAGFSAQATYDYAKNLTNAAEANATTFSGDAGSSLVNRFDQRYTRGNSPGSRRNRMLFTGIYELPFGKGKPFLANAPPVVNGVLGGWQLSTITLAETGPYVTVSTSAALDQSNTNLASRGGTARPDAIGNANVANTTTGSIWSIGAFANTPAGAGRFGNAGIGTLQAPGTVTVAGGLSKTFRIAELARLRFEATFTNLLNHPNFAIPARSITTPSTFGILTSVQTAENAGNRAGQLSLRLQF